MNKKSSIWIAFITLMWVFSCSIGSTHAAKNDSDGTSSSESQETKDEQTQSSTGELKGNKEKVITDSSQESEKKTTGEKKEDDTLADKKLRKEINTYILESYKAQGNKIIKDLSNTLTRSIPDVVDRKIAYEKIRDSLIIRIEQTNKNETISETKKEILIEFLKHLTHLLEKKISELE